MNTLRQLVAAACVSLLALVASDAAAHPGHDHTDDLSASRTWTSADSGMHWQGTFVSAKEGKVQVRRDDGKLVSLSIEQLSGGDKNWIERRLSVIRALNEQPTPEKLRVFAPAPQSASESPAIAKAFDPFAKLKAITYRWDDRNFYVESNGLPDHPLMVGITAWQQQVPLPQKYVGGNAWQIPLVPVPAKEPATAKNRFLRGAIALAVNGVPIFNPLNNRGDDAYLFGELDEYGGHCGRADDYHYHIAPVHLEKLVGKGSIIAYALDGYPIYGYDEPDGGKVTGLDKLNGHKDAEGHYHYHATKTYPYLNGGFHGEVTERDGQVDPQPRAAPLRPALPPLRGAKIVGFDSPKANSYHLTYEINGRKGTVDYTIAADGSVAFQYTDPAGKTTSETYSPSRRLPGQGGNPPPGKGKGAPPPRSDKQTSVNAGEGNDPTSKPSGSASRLVVTSSALDAKGFLSAEFTCDGESASPPVAWKDVPEGTKSFALCLWHTAPDQVKSYWVVYDIPASTTGLEKNSKTVGKIGLNDKRRKEYDPMCSKGPGVKTYHITVFALSKELKLTPDKATRANLLAAIKDIKLAEGTLDFQYERKPK